MKNTDMINGLRLHQEEAFDECYYTYKNLVYYVIIKITRDHELSEELVQDTFIKMYQSIESFDGRYFQAWLLTIAKNLAINEIKKRKITVEYNDYLIADVIDNDQKMKDLLNELEEVLNPTEYEIVILSTIYNMRQMEIAEYLKMPRGTVAWMYREALKKFKIYQKGTKHEN